MTSTGAKVAAVFAVNQLADVEYDGTDVVLLDQLPAAAASTGVIGTTRNLKMAVTAASATATLTADEIVLGVALGGAQIKVASFSKTINLATTGAGAWIPVRPRSAAMSRSTPSTTQQPWHPHCLA
jgi:hypothetical protein